MSLPIIYCDKHHQTLIEAAIAHGYDESVHRTGVTHDSCPMSGEETVAMIKAARYSLALPLFRKKIVEEE